MVEGKLPAGVPPGVWVYIREHKLYGS
jgi:hypothetical protein